MEPIAVSSCSKSGISALVKCTFAIRQLAYAAVPDSLDESLQIGEKTSCDCSNNDVNGLRQSPVLNDLKVGKAPEVPFVANDVTYKWGYYLTDGIYPEWVVLRSLFRCTGLHDVKRIRYNMDRGDGSSLLSSCLAMYMVNGDIDVYNIYAPICLTDFSNASAATGPFDEDPALVDLDGVVELTGPADPTTAWLSAL
ncbi:ALP1-like protein [Tanacetum coccineum]